MSDAKAYSQIERDTLATLTSTSRGYWIGLGAAVTMVSIGGTAWALVLREGLGLLGLNAPVMWGCLITTFVFFIGVSHSGTLVSAILFFTR